MQTVNQHPRRLAVPPLFTRLLALLVGVALIVTGCGPSASPSNANTGPTAAPADAVKVSFVYGSEKKAWVEAVTQRYNANNARTASGKLIVVETLAMGSGESMTDTLDGKLQPTLWSPASRIWIPLLNDGWATAKGKDLVTEACKDAVISPVVIMMWKPMAEALGWPDKAIGWSDIAAIATNPQGFAAAPYNKPQLGKFRFGHTHPDYSNSGLQTIIAMAYAGLGKTRGLDVEDIKKPELATFLSSIEGAVSHYGSSTGFFGDAMIARGTSYLSAAVVYESVVVSSYDPTKSPEFPLVAIYPKEGTFLSDHPMCIPDAPWISAEQKEAAEAYRNYLLSEPIQREALNYGFRPALATIPVTAPIDAAHGVDPKQPTSTLDVPKASVIREIRALWAQKKRQVNLTLVIDVSGSMNSDNKIKLAREGAQAFIDQLSDSDNLTLVVFSTTNTTVFENLNVGENRTRMKNEVNSIVASGGTALYDAIVAAVKSMKLDPARINGLVVLTDGEDTNSVTYRSAEAVISELNSNSESSQTDISVFTISYGDGAKDKVLKQIADALRGAFRKGGTADIVQIYREISTFF